VEEAMTKNDRQVEFKVGDRVASLDSNEEGTITRLCSDKDIVYVRWDASKMQEMVETRTLRRANS